MRLNKILSTTITCLLFTPLMLVVVPVVFSPPAEGYALDFAGGTSSYLDNEFNELTYFSFYTFFKSGIELDCIEMTEKINNEV